MVYRCCPGPAVRCVTFTEEHRGAFPDLPRWHGASTNTQTWDFLTLPRLSLFHPEELFQQTLQS